MILIIADTIISLCLFVLFTSIIINFAEAKNKEVKREHKSIVETGTMTLFFFGFYLLIRFKVGALIVDTNLRNMLIVLGLIMIVSGCAANIIGRFNLGKNWANQVQIYDNQTFMNTGMFALVRHPLYASLMLMFYGATLVYPNYLALIANTIIFIPFMYYRAKQEETLLTKTFQEYEKYQHDVGMFFPKLIKRANK